MSNKNRYNRQVILPEIGIEGQEKLSKAKVLCIGAGGLGCPTLLYLSAAGIGNIGIVDFDNVDESNLQRQVLFTIDDIGKNKALAAKTRLNALNPEIKITAYNNELNDKNAEKLFGEYDLIIDGTDNFSAKFLINDAAVKMGKPFIYGSILGFDGQVSVFNHKGCACYRCLFPAPPKGHIPNCAEAGVIGAVAGIIGTTQAMEAIKIIVNNHVLEPLSGKLLTIDVHNMDCRTLTIPKNPNCPTCSKEKKEIKLTNSSQTCGVISECSPEDVKSNANATIIDVREKNEWDSGHIENALHFALSDLAAGKIPDLPKDQEIILYCKKGMRGQQADQILKAKGFTNITNMCGGYDAWCE